jgi:di/tricarboxylate transporter
MSTDKDREGESSLLGEFAMFLRQHKAWWMVPLLVALLLFVILIFVSGTATTPFIYTTH